MRTTAAVVATPDENNGGGGNSNMTAVGKTSNAISTISCQIHSK
jgi:hypothetical protein